MDDEVTEIQPVDNDGVVVVSIGTVAWFIALIVLLFMHHSLRDDGHLWWIACAATGFGLGLLGIGYCARRRSRTERRNATSATPG